MELSHLARDHSLVEGFTFEFSGSQEVVGSREVAVGAHSLSEILEFLLNLLFIEVGEHKLEIILDHLLSEEVLGELFITRGSLATKAASLVVSELALKGLLEQVRSKLKSSLGLLSDFEVFTNFRNELSHHLIVIESNLVSAVSQLSEILESDSLHVSDIAHHFERRLVTIGHVVLIFAHILE